MQIKDLNLNYQRQIFHLGCGMWCFGAGLHPFLWGWINTGTGKEKAMGTLGRISENISITFPSYFALDWEDSPDESSAD